ncbi:hypothetical protein [uncultured Kordia sp.]|uniref:hypothetical protein n=1 Tax=uncultured Kordia sp. TaxID=507699 RepID=UPI00260DE20F|nr:hypothetical protein [uncultured Kordia sp.]
MNTVTLKNTISWWEKKRIAFNFFVGITGVIAVLAFIPHTFGMEDAIGIVLWGIMANILYSAGILLEVANQYYLKGKLNIFQFRLFFFVAGTFTYMLVTWAYTGIYYDPFFFVM